MSDIHANIKALERAIKKFNEIGVDDIFVCGDIVGYGNNPNECCDLIRESGYKVILGNHDWGLLGRNGINGFHKSIYTHKDLMSQKNVDWLDGLPLVINKHNIEFSHAELVKPENFEYLHSCEYSYRNRQFEVIKNKLCFIGHSHFKEMFIEDKPGGRIYHRVIKGDEDMTQYLKKHRTIVSVGSVGICCNKSKRRNVVIYNKEKNSVKYVVI